ncbi:hypothetical protein LIS44_00380 [Acinetobacter haemolyticus]|uniref:hypothetical protein n=1 Tax=unclassified Acinetobacter TaxID=196816 RepID=UPI0015D41FA3|nr:MULTISPECIES: hypothetical protein [unclassified Acinetobacter]MDD2946679.1 hypothetical protein [Acinetobacter sp.]UDM38333.1 hypothetical protein LIS44_00380 [Acinetobacter haemolyticus]
MAEIADQNTNLSIGKKYFFNAFNALFFCNDTASPSPSYFQKKLKIKKCNDKIILRQGMSLAENTRLFFLKKLRIMLA